VAAAGACSSADYSQIELRVLAHLSRDPILVDAFQRDEDVHARTAMEVFKVKREDVTREMRARAKTVNFAVIYGQGDVGPRAAAQHQARGGRGVYRAVFPHLLGPARPTWTAPSRPPARARWCRPSSADGGT
jgi:hypothetical protein